MLSVVVLRSLAAVCILSLASGCIDEARCDAALEGVARARREAAQRDHQIAWLGWSQAQLAAAVRDGGARDIGRDALLQRIASLEAENRALAQRLGDAEREVAAPRTPPARRHLDEAVPYERSLLAAPRANDDEGLVRRGAPRASRTLDEVVPYELPRGARAARREAPRTASLPSRRTLDEAVPY